MQNTSPIELHPVSQRVQLPVDETLIADSTQDLELRVIRYPLRHYFPHEYVPMDLINLSETTTFACSKVMRLISFWVEQNNVRS